MKNIKRKATFIEKVAQKGSSAHNSRSIRLNYLVSPRCQNYYKHYFGNDNNFKRIAEEAYIKNIKQKMQAKQKEKLIFEAVLTLSNDNSVEDILGLFNKLNKNYGGHTVVELSIHEDEGHFVDKNGLVYMPGKHVIEKNEEWYRVKNDEEGVIDEDFCIKVDISKFQIVYNRHAHVKFSKIDLKTGKSSRMQKRDMSQRLKVVADYLNLAYVPEEKKSLKRSVNNIKDDYAELREQKLINMRLNTHNNNLQNQLILLKEQNTLLEAQAKIYRDDHERLIVLENENKQLKKKEETIIFENTQTLKAKSIQYEEMKMSLLLQIETLHEESKRLKRVMERQELNYYKIEKKFSVNQKERMEIVNILSTDLKQAQNVINKLTLDQKELNKNLEKLYKTNSELVAENEILKKAIAEKTQTVKKKDQQFLTKRMIEENKKTSKFKW